MLLDPGPARWLLVAHTALGVAAVAASTHLCVWLARYLGGAAGRRRAVLRFSTIAVTLHAAALVAGLLAYPTYKARVRVEYLDRPDVVTADAEIRAQAHADAIARADGRAPERLPDGELAHRAAGTAGAAARMAKWFDSKEHWIAVGLVLSLAVAILLRRWDPERDGRAAAPFLRWAALGACATLWYAAVIGILTASWRAI